MIKIGKYYYKNFWAYIQVKVFKKSTIIAKGRLDIKPFIANSMEDWTKEDFLYGNFHEECGDR